MRALLAFAMLGIPAVGTALPLTDIPSLVDRKNEDVAAARKDAEGSESGVVVAWARLLPQVHWRSTYVHLGTPITLQIPSQTLGPATLSFAPIELQKRDVVLSTLIATWPIFSGGRISAGIAGADAQRAESKAMLKKTSQEKTREAASRYFSAQLARRVIVLMEAMNASLERLRTISESMVRTGLGPKFSVLQIRVAQADLRSRLAEARGKAQLADLAFKTSVLLPAAEAVTYETPLRKIPMPAELDDLKKRALERRSELEILRAKGGQAEALRRYHVGEMLPTVALVGAKNLTGGNLPVLTPEWYVGLTIDVPLTAWIGGLAERDKVVRLEQKVEILKGKADQEIPLEVEKFYREAQAAEAALTANDEGIEMAREAARLAEVRFKNGDGAAVELLRAQTDLEKTEIRSLQLLDEYNQKLLETYRAAGDVGRFIDAYRSS